MLGVELEAAAAILERDVAKGLMGVPANALGYSAEKALRIY